jgi:hypothetical protein
VRKRARIDQNHAEIVDALRKVGCSVLSLAPMGDGCPDALVGFRGVDQLMEIKNGALPASRRVLTADERDFIANWRGRPVIVVNSVSEALAAVR